MDINRLRSRAEEGSTVAQGALGRAYLFGVDGLDVDYAEALRWLTPAAEAGAYGPIGLLGHMYEHGLGVEKDVNKAIHLYKDAAARGSMNDTIHLARMYAQGLEVPINTMEALRWYTVVFADSEYEPDAEDVAEAKHFLTSIEGHEQALINLLERDPIPIVRARAARALGNLGVKSALGALLEAASNTQEVVRSAIIFALGNFTEWEAEDLPSKSVVTKLLLAFMDDDDDQVREAAAATIGWAEHDTPETRKKMSAALDDRYSGVRAYAAVGLSYFGDEALTPKLEWLLLNGELSPLYFVAAEHLGDSELLPSVIAAAKRWRQTEPDSESADNSAIQSAIDYLTEVANGSPEDPPYLRIEYMRNWPAQAGQLLTRIGNVDKPDGNLISEGLVATVIGHYDLAIMVLESPSLSIFKRCLGAESALLLGLFNRYEGLNYSIVENLMRADPTDTMDALEKCSLVKTTATIGWPSQIPHSAGAECLLSAARFLGVHLDVPRRLTRRSLLRMCEHVSTSYLESDRRNQSRDKG